MKKIAVAERPASFVVNGVKNTYVDEIPLVEVQQVDQREQDASRIGTLLKLKGEAEQEIAKILRKRLDADGERKWLAWCEEQWGWKQTQAYRHLNSERLQEDRDRAKARRQSVDRPQVNQPTDDEIEDADIWLEDQQVKEQSHRMREEWERKEQARQASHALTAPLVDMLELIEAGYRSLAKQRHPDVGGSNDAMTRLTAARDRAVNILQCSDLTTVDRA